MADTRVNLVLDEETVDMQIIDCGSSEEEDFFYTVPTQNRFDHHYTQRSGRGSEGKNAWQTERRPKRKKVSSGSVETGSFSVLSTDEKLESLFEVVNRNNQVLTDIQRDQLEFCKTTRDLQVDMAKLNERVDRVQQATQQQSNCIRMLAYRSIDTEARSRRNNIIFWGITEKSRISADNLVLNFVQEMLGIDVTGMVIDRAHRLGSAQTDRNGADAKRPIIARFRDYQDTETIIRKAFKLKGTPFGIDRDYPKEIADARRQLYKSEEARHARDRRMKIQIRYPAKLFVNGQLKRDLFPDWHETLQGNRLHDISFETVNRDETSQNRSSGQRNSFAAAPNKDRMTGDGDGSDSEFLSGHSTVSLLQRPESSARKDVVGIDSGHAPSSPNVNNASHGTPRDHGANGEYSKDLPSSGSSVRRSRSRRRVKKGASGSIHRARDVYPDTFRDRTKHTGGTQTTAHGRHGSKNSARVNRAEHEVESTHL